MRKIIVPCLLLLIASFGGNINCCAENKDFNWSQEERDFLENPPLVRLGVDPRFVPFEFVDEKGEHRGIAADYLQLISEKTGLLFEIQEGLTWPETYDLALKGHLDALPAVGKTPEREEHFLFSEPYYYFKRVIATLDTDVHISGLEDLAGLTMAVQRNSSHHSYLLPYEKINLSLYDSVEAALTAVAAGSERAFLGNLATTNYIIRSNGLTNLRFVAFEAEKQEALYFAVRQDWPQLVSIINKAVEAITAKEKADINKKWIDLETHLDYSPLIRMVLISAAFFGVVLVVSFFWIGRLRQEINERKQIQKSLEMANRKADQVNSKLQKANEELAKISVVDGLTGIPNRRYFDDFLQKLWPINTGEHFPLALIMVDIDHFKKYNDTYGHLAGDQCLKRVAHLINATVKRAGDFVARYGGEEFAVLLSNTTEEGAAELAEKIRQKIEKAIIKNGTADTALTVSLGVAAMVATEGLGPEDLILAADNALYMAKSQGRNKVIVANSL